MIHNAKAYLRELIDKHEKVSRERITFFEICGPVLRFLDIGHDDHYITIRGIEYEIKKRSELLNTVCLNGKYAYDFNVTCGLHNFIPYTGLNEKYHFCKCGEKVYA